MRGPVVVVPIRPRCDDTDEIVSLRLTKSNVILKARRRSDGPLLVIVVPAKNICPGGPPRIPNDEEWSAIRLFQSVVVGCRPQKSTAHRVLFLLRIRPVDGVEAARLIIQARIRWIRSTLPGPGAGLGGDHAHAKRIAPVPKPIHTLLEVRPRQVNPDRYIRVCVGEALRSGQGHFLLFPNVHLCLGERGRYNQSEYEWDRKQIVEKFSCLSLPSRVEH